MGSAAENYRAALERADARLVRLLERFAWLDDMREVLRRDPLRVRKAIREYVQGLGPIVAGIDRDVIARVVAAEQAAELKRLRKYEGLGGLKSSAARAQAALRAIVLDQSANARTILQSMQYRMNAKVANLVTQAAAMGLHRERAGAELDRRLETIRFYRGGREVVVPAADLQRVWDGLETRYGTTATVTYRDGKNYPIQTYVEQKGQTIERDVQTSVAAVEAAAAGLAVGQFESYGSADSCAIWEGRFFFWTESGKRSFLRAHGDRYPEARTWRVYADIKADKTHMQSFNCRHKALSVPLEYLDREDFEPGELRPAPRVPRTSRGVRLMTEAIV